jgi:hypothetical protein
MRKKIILPIAFLLVLVWLLRGKEDPLFQGGRETGGKAAVSSSPGETNHPPRLTRVEIVPSEPDLQSMLTVAIQAEDPDQDTVTYRYRWSVNKKEVGDRPILSLKGFRQEDLVSVEVTPSDGKAEGPSLSGPTVKIGNHPPIVTKIVLLPMEPKVGEAVKAQVEGRDEEGDTIYYGYQWEINGQPVEGVAGDLLDGTLIHSADQIRVLVTPSDSFDTGTQTASRPIAVINQPPEIISSPTSEINENQYRYQVVARDPDGDQIEYLLDGGPPGMGLDPMSGLLVWKVEMLAQGTVPVTIRAIDKKGGKSIQQFTLQTR